MRVLITGSGGLIGSEAVIHYATEGHDVLGIDNNMRRYFFGPQGDTSKIQLQLSDFKNYRNESLDIRDRESVFRCMKDFKPEFILHTAAQPSHDWAARQPFTDFEVNAMGTLNLLEGLRSVSPDAVFVLTSTNKVYGDNPNRLPLEETDTRWEYVGPLRGQGIDETLSTDNCLHSLFGVSKLAGDVLAQEYGRYFGLKTGVFRGGCLTGSRHAAVELHGFLTYLITSAIRGEPYTIFGYKGKQVRDQIHSSDVIQAVELFRKAPRPGEAYNLGGGFENSASVLEVVDRLDKQYGLKLKSKYVGEARRGDHICYYSDMTKFRTHYPKFKLQKSLDEIIREIVSSRVSEARRAA